MDSVSALMSGLIDYAGLFPPAGLGMRDAVANYAEYLGGPDSRSLGSFVLPVDRIPEFDEAVGQLPTPSGSWRISLLMKDDTQEVFGSNGSLRAHSAHDWVKAVSVEMPFKIFQSRDVTRSASTKPYETYVEVPVADDVISALPAIAAGNARAKMRTGGVSPDAFPSTYHIIRFMRACCSLGIAFKATAGLHHPLRAEFPLTYEPGSARARMYGFLNVFLAAAFMWNGADDGVAAKILEESDPSTFAFTSSGVSWRGIELSTNRIAAARESFAHSFGSCSFREPVDEMRTLLSATTGI